MGAKCATSLRPFSEDVIVNMSVWRDLDTLRRFVYDSGHTGFSSAVESGSLTRPRLMPSVVGTGRPSGVPRGSGRTARATAAAGSNIYGLYLQQDV